MIYYSSHDINHATPLNMFFNNIMKYMFGTDWNWICISDRIWFWIIWQECDFLSKLHLVMIYSRYLVRSHQSIVLLSLLTCFSSYYYIEVLFLLLHIYFVLHFWVIGKLVNSLSLRNLIYIVLQNNTNNYWFLLQLVLVSFAQ